MKQVEALVHFSATPKDPKQYKSAGRLHTDWVKHARLEYSHQETLKAPMTTQQEIGGCMLSWLPATTTNTLRTTVCVFYV